MARIDDPNRIDALHRSGLLRHDVQERLSSLCYSAVQLCRADASMINVQEGGLQQVAAVWPADAHPHEKLPYRESGCREVLETEETVAVPDTTEHPILCTVPWTNRWRGYLGTPVSYEGQIIGSICVLTRAPRVWQPHDMITLQGLARLVGMVLD